MATHFSILACEIPWTEGPGELQSTGSQKSRTRKKKKKKTGRMSICVPCRLTMGKEQPCVFSLVMEIYRVFIPYVTLLTSPHL